jgi:electron transport complex protein RnfE
MNHLTAWQAKRKGLTLDPNFDAGCAGCAACKGLEKIVQQKKLERLESSKG